MTVPVAELRTLGMQMVELCAREGIDARLLGSVAIAIIADDSLANRPAPPKDMDIILRAGDRRRIYDLLISESWAIDDSKLLQAELREHYVRDGIDLDVFYDYIDGNHRIDLRERLNVSYPTIAWTDLLLSKLQRVAMRDVDVSDVVLLARDGAERVDMAYWTAVLGDDWGLYTSVTDNLERLVRDDRVSELLPILQASVSAEKSLSWHLRSYVGRRLRWWNTVYDM